MRELRPLEGDLRQREAVKERWLGNAFAFWTQAKELALLPPATPTPRGIEAIVTALGQVLRDYAQRLPLPELGTAEQAVKDLECLRERERKLSGEIGDRKRRLRRLVSLSGAASGYSEALSLEQERLGGLGWFKKHLAHTSNCPMCGSAQDSAQRELERLQGLAAELARETQTLARGQPMIDKERATIAEDLRDLEERQRHARQALQQLEQRTPRNFDQDTSLEQVHRYLGRLEQALSDRNPDDDKVLKEQIRIRQERLGEIARRLDSANRQQRLQTALARVSRNLTEYARLLDLERAEEVIELDIQALNLKFSDPERSRRDMLSDLGSGENWMGYHIATFLALHQSFATQHYCPVPNFLVIDQPSQVYFPGEILDEHAHGERPELSDKDKRATRRIFEALAAGIGRIGGSFQVIVTEHADEGIWGNIEGVRLTERWRGDADYLIPREWLG